MQEIGQLNLKLDNDPRVDVNKTNACKEEYKKEREAWESQCR